MDTWKNCVLSAGKPPVHKIPRFRGGGLWGFGGGVGGSADSIFMGARIFLIFSSCEKKNTHTHTHLVFLSVFPFFSRDFRGSAGIKRPCFFGGIPCLFPKEKTRKGRTRKS